MKKITIAIVAVLMSLSMNSQIAWNLDTNNVTIGDQVTLSLSGVESWPTMEDLSQGKVLALKQWMDTAKGVQYTTLTCFDEGEWPIKITDEDSLVLVVNDVADVDTVTAEVKDIADIMKVRYTFWEIFRWILLGLAVLFVAGAVTYIVIRLKKHKPIIELKKEPPVPPEQRALAALEDLRVQQLWQQGKIKEYHTELTDIVRGYLEEGWGIASTDMTSDETLEAYRRSRCFSDILEEKLSRMLRTADMVKFAKSEPMPYEHDRSLSDAVDFVNTLGAQALAEREAAKAKKQKEERDNDARNNV
jgi:hypothetical protein